MSSRRVLLIDGSALVYRAWFAIPANLRTAGGLHTNAIYGFATMFRKMLSGRRPALGAVVFDAPGPTFREEKYPEYKIQRPPMPDELREQLGWIDRVVEAHRFPILRVAGVEADDVIGTLARRAEAAGEEVLIVSGDKDFAQLIGERIRMVDPIRDLTYDVELVRKKWGVPPEQFVDWLALVGDRSDNVPGVPGIGKKGATTLLAEHGDLATLLERAGEISGRAGTSLSENAEIARLSRELVTIDCDVSLEVGLEDLAVDPPEPRELNGLYRELEFHSLLSEDAVGSASEVEYGWCRTVSEVAALVEGIGDEPAAVVALWDDVSPARGDVVGFAIGSARAEAVWIPIAGPDGLGTEGFAALRDWFADARRPKVTFDAKRLTMCVRRLGGRLEGVEGDVMLESFLVEPTRVIPHRLRQIAREYLQKTLPDAKTVRGSGKEERAFGELSADELASWAARRADAVFRLAPILREKVEDAGLLDVLRDVDLPLARVLADMELAGIAVDPEDLARLETDFEERLRDLEAEVHGLAGHEFNLASTQQLSKVLFEELDLPVILRTKTGFSTNAEVLQRLTAQGHRIAEAVLEHRSLAKLVSTYTRVLREAVHSGTGRIHATFQQTVGATGRLISTDPDLQRTPVKTPEGRRIRRAFVPAPGLRIVSADWSQIELRLLAHFTGDPGLVEAFREGADVHARTAGELFGVDPKEVTRSQRGVGKLVNFATIYGQGATALGKIVGVSRKEAQAYIDGYFRAYSGVREWLDETVARAHERGWVETILGRRRFIPELASRNPTDRTAGERIAANTPIQGSAADLCKLAMLAIARRLEGMETRMLLQIHDELVFEAPPDEVDAVTAIAREEMEKVGDLDVPLVVDVGVGDSWAEAH